MKQEKCGNIMLNLQGCTFIFTSGDELTFNYDKMSSLHVAYAYILPLKKKSGVMGYLDAASTQRLNISKSQEDLLLWHNIFGHYDIMSTRKMMRSTSNDIEPDIKPHTFTTATCGISLCMSCLTGKG